MHPTFSLHSPFLCLGHAVLRYEKDFDASGAFFLCVSGLNYSMFATTARSYVPQLSLTRTETQRIDMNASVRVSNKKYPCANCPSVFSRVGGLTYHQKFECGQEPRFKCPYCIYCAKHNSNTRRHVRKYHPDQKLYTVDLCEFQLHGQTSGRSAPSWRMTIHEDWMKRRASYEDFPLEALLRRTVETPKILLFCSRCGIVRLHEEYRIYALRWTSYTMYEHGYIYFFQGHRASLGDTCSHRSHFAFLIPRRPEELNCEDGR